MIFEPFIQGFHDVVGFELFQVALDYLAEGHHDLGEVALGRFVHPALVGYVQIGSGDVGTEEVAGEKDLFLFQVGDHGLGPVHPGGVDELQRLAADVHGFAVCYRHEPVFRDKQQIPKHSLGLLGADNLGTGILFQDCRYSAGVILLGPIYDKPEFIINAYRDWVLGPPKNKVVIPYVSMHSSTRQMVDYLVAALVERDVEVERFDLTVTDIGKLAMSLVDAATIVVGTPTVLAGPHPAAAYATFLANAIRPKAKFLSIIGSYGWGGKTVEILASMIPNLEVEVIEPVLIKGVPLKEDFAALDKMADAIAAKHEEAGLM
ncbi:Anaerobic nitric oxide reductase flavorubredoxin [subsurface metagenome]